MADFLTAVSTKKTKDLQPPTQEIKSLDIHGHGHIDSKESALQAIKHEPNLATVKNVLKYLALPESSLLLPEPLNASIAHQLVNDTIPNYWRVIKNSTQVKLIAKILRNPTGLGHLLTRLRSLIVASQQKQTPGKPDNKLEHIEDVSDLLNHILSEDNASNLVLQDVIAHGKSALQKKLIWREYLSQIASGRVLSIVAEAENVLKAKEPLKVTSWIADGNIYASWVGRNIANLMLHDSKNEEYIIAIVEICSKALGLGYTGQ